MKDNFIFYHSFRDTIMRSPNKEDRNQLVWYLIDCALGIIDIEDVPYPFDMVIDQMMISVGRAQSRYEEATKSGNKGGRPKKWVDREEAERLFSKLESWHDVAEELGVSEDTLYRARMKWKSDSAKPQNPQNLSISESISDSISVSVSESVSKSDSDKRNLNNNKLPGNTATDPNGSPCTVEKNGAKRPEAEPTPEESRAVIDRLIAATPERERKPNAGREHNSS